MNFDVQSHRVGDESNQDGKTDARLIALNTLLDSTLGTATPSKVVEDLTQVLTTAYGSANVSSSSSPLNYMWHWDIGNHSWVFECRAGTTLTVVDGAQQPVEVQITIRQTVA